MLRWVLDLPDPATAPPDLLVPEHPDLWPDLCGTYGTAPGLNTNVRVWLQYGGEAQVYVKDRHLALRGLAGPLRGGVRLYPVDAADPLVFALEYKSEMRYVVFERTAAGEVRALGLGFHRLYKRPTLRSLRFRFQAGLAAGAGLATTALARRQWRRG